ncbi:DNA polymerase III subunit delta [Phycisphaerales bacterium AB-hyl4]|uniref:DNA polymerase III subunit delta n=1 Tax=Natronomicrosphaera hydrolytica TaxID=3242702 RepID=A0ABV4U251_9BACT
MARSRAPARKADVTLDASMRLVVLHGPDDMLKQTRLHELRAALAAEHGEVETFSFEGKTAPLADVLDELRGYSLMQTYKLVLVDEADLFVKTHREALERYAENPVDHATLLLRSGTWNRGNLDKLIAKHGAIIKCDAPSPAEAKAWLVARAKKQHKTTITPAAAEALIDRLGPRLMQLDTELAKLALMVDEGSPIEPKLVQDVVGRSSEEQAWAVQEVALQAMQQRNPGALITSLRELIDLAGQPDALVAYFLADLMRKLNVAWMLRQAGVPEAAAAKQLKLWGPRQALFFNALRQMSPARAAALFDGVLQADRRSKSGLGEAVRNLECFSVQLTDNTR